MRRFLVLINIVMALCLATGARAQQAITYPANDGDRLECKVLIETSKGYVSGICVLLHEGNDIKGAIINEFGITALDFTYDTQADKVKLNSVIAMLDKWYIRSVLAKDIRELLLSLKQGQTRYEDSKYKITYSLSPMDNAIDNNADGEDIPDEDDGSADENNNVNE